MTMCNSLDISRVPVIILCELIVGMKNVINSLYLQKNIVKEWLDNGFYRGLCLFLTITGLCSV